MVPIDMICGFIHHTKNGDIEIIEYTDMANVYAKFKLSGYPFRAKSQAIREGRITDRLSPTVLGVAMIGDGEYKNTINYKTTRAYKVWVGIIYRCYDKKNNNYHLYGGRGVTVCEEWLNFQNFAKWYYENIPDDGSFQIDKDLNGGNIYSPKHCVFLTRQRNSELANAKEFTMIAPNGDVISFYNMAKFCRDNDLVKSMLHRVYTGKRKSHRGWKALC